MKKTKLFLSITLCAAFFLGISSNASAVLVNQTYSGDPVVYDSLNDLYWYPMLTDFTGMTRAEQLAEIDDLVYGGSSDWRMANFMETTALKWSLAEMATVEVLPTSFGPLLGSKDTGVRTLSSPNLAWEVEGTQFFTPTNNEGFEIFGMPGLVFNGRYAGLGWVNDFVSPLHLDYGDDHWMAHNFMTPGAPEGYYLTMMFNSDGHPVGDEATDHGMFGGIGAWAVTRSVPEPATMLLFGSGLLVLAGLGRRKFKKG